MGEYLSSSACKLKQIDVSVNNFDDSIEVAVDNHCYLVDVHFIID